MLVPAYPKEAPASDGVFCCSKQVSVCEMRKNQQKYESARKNTGQGDGAKEHLGGHDMVRRVD